MNFSFRERLAFSVDARGQEDIDIITRCHNGSIAIEKADTQDDISGVDYFVTLDSGVQVKWDVKRRDIGCSRFWKSGPELALETWSDMERGRIGWTLDREKETDYILFAFDPSDHDRAYAIPFQHLRAAFNANGPDWYKRYRHEKQSSRENGREWVSECVFIPIHEVLDAINSQMVREA